jgi:hypothetical protein
LGRRSGRRPPLSRFRNFHLESIWRIDCFRVCKWSPVDPSVVRPFGISQLSSGVHFDDRAFPTRPFQAARRQLAARNNRGIRFFHRVFTMGGVYHEAVWATARSV